MVIIDNSLEIWRGRQVTVRKVLGYLRELVGTFYRRRGEYGVLESSDLGGNGFE
jgi:hypothetical protein